MQFVDKEYFLLLLLVIPYLLWYFLFRKNTEPTMRMSDTYVYRHAPKSWRQRMEHVPMLLRLLAFTLLVCALARPQTHTAWGRKSVEGIDIMLAMDVSTSMLAEDLRPNRLEAAKDVAAEFISGRPDDNIGLTIFAGEAFTQCPMTVDHQTLLNLLHSVRTDIAKNTHEVKGDYNNVIEVLEETYKKSKVVILLTDGSNNQGDISPMTAAEIARSFNIRVYTIGVGTNKTARYPISVGGTVQYVNMPAEIDVETLRNIAATTDGNFYRATNTAELKKIYKDIDQLERTKFDVQRFSRRYEGFLPFIIGAALALIIEILLRTTLLRRIP